jgi:hypothetical protein
LSPWIAKVQVRRAIALGLGATGPDEVELIAEDFIGDDPNFTKLLTDVRRNVGLWGFVGVTR